MPAFAIQRKVLTAGVSTPITAPFPCSGVVVGNATPGDVQVLSQTTDATQYLIITAGYEHMFQSPGGHLFRFDFAEIAFYLNSVAGGAVVLTWLS